MRTVLLDGTTVMAAHRLIQGADPPTALNVTALALLVEAIVLHDHAITLETSGFSDFEKPEFSDFDSAAATFGQVIRVEHVAVDTVLNRYVAIEFPEFVAAQKDHPEDLEAVRRGDTESSPSRASLDSEISQVQRHIYKLLHLDYYDPDSEDFFRQLNEAHTRATNALIEAQEARRSWISRAAEDRLSRLSLEDRLPRLTLVASLVAALVSIPFRGQPRALTTELDDHRATYAMQEAWHDFVTTYRSSTSAWAERELADRRAWSEFRPSLLIRTHFYLMASEVYDAPYRPDLIRGPICYKFFDQPTANVGIDERLVDLAEEASSNRLETLHKRLGRRPFALLPLFLGAVLAKVSQPSDVMDCAYEIRRSAPARRFRDYTATLAEAETTGDIELLTKDLDRAAAALQKIYGSPGPPADVIWDLVGSGLKAGFFPSPITGVDLGAAAGKASVNAGIGAIAWWHQRKLALITRAAKQSYAGGDLQHQMMKVFGGKMSPGDLDFLEQLSKFSTASHKE